jgi:hypothetical protein
MPVVSVTERFEELGHGQSNAAFRVSRNVPGDGTLLPAIGFLAIERRHVDLEVATGLKDTAFRAHL